VSTQTAAPPQKNPGASVPLPAASPKEPPRIDDIVIGMGVTSSGNFTTGGAVCIDGVLKDGDIQALTLSVSRGGEFHGRATARFVEIFGKVNGDLTATDQIILRASAEVTGRISAPYITMHRGACVNGEVMTLERNT
jgi:cytoskeletal protein CcmA (bactofilin family)